MLDFKNRDNLKNLITNIEIFLNLTNQLFLVNKNNHTIQILRNKEFKLLSLLRLNFNLKKCINRIS